MADIGLLVPLRVTSVEVKMLEFLASRGGETSWDWSRCRDDVRAMMRGMIDDKQLVSEVQRDGRGYVRLTDRGRSALSQVEEQVRRARGVLT